MHARACPSISMGMPPMHVPAKRMQSATDGLVTSLAPHDARNSAPEAPLSPSISRGLYDALLRVHTGAAPTEALPAEAPCAWESMMVAGCNRQRRSKDCPRCLQKAKWGAPVKGVVPLVRVACTPSQLDRVKPLP